MQNNGVDVDVVYPTMGRISRKSSSPVVEGDNGGEATSANPPAHQKHAFVEINAEPEASSANTLCTVRSRSPFIGNTSDERGAQEHERHRDAEEKKSNGE